MRRSSGIIALGSIPVLGILGASLLFSGVVSDASLISHTLEVKNKLAALLSAAQDIEIGQRGYLITGKDEFLAPYTEAVGSIFKIHEEAVGLVTDNPQQTSDLNALKTLLSERITIANMNLELRRSGSALDISELERGKVAMEGIRNAIAEAQRNEDALFAVRQAALSSRRAWLVVVLTTSLLAAAGVAFAIRRREEERSREMTRANLILAEARDDLERKVEERTAALAKERDRAEALLRDVTHRIGNTLTLVVGFLNLHIRHARDPEAIKTLSGARERVMAISSTQRRMNVSNDLELVRIDSLVKGVLDDLTEAQSHTNIEVMVDIAPAYVAAREATTVCVLIQEFVINAVKHAFPDGREGKISVQLRPMPEQGAILTVADNGVGHLPTAETGAGLGTQISDRLARQFEGNVEFASEGGLVVTVKMPGLSLKAPEAT